MGALYDEVRRHEVLYGAWRQVRENGVRSTSEETKAEVGKFEERPFANLKRLQRQLQEQKFRFSPQKGVPKRRRNKLPRPIVMAPIENRIVQRAILDVLQKRVQAVMHVLSTPQSVGGVKDRGVDHAIAQVQAAVRNGAKHYIRSDIADFFTKIPRSDVVEFVRQHVDDAEFVGLFEAAVTTELANLASLGEEVRRLFPLQELGVAQGSPLSPLIGNILLRGFDAQLNGRGITCIRYIDDFIILGDRAAKVTKAFDAGLSILKGFGMTAYDPASSEKASAGEVGNGFDFLGFHIQADGVSPSQAAREELLRKVQAIIREGKQHIREAVSADGDRVPRERAAQVLCRVDRVVRGWGHAFSITNARDVFDSLDTQIDRQLADFRHFVGRTMADQDRKARRRVQGVHLLIDTPRRPLPSVPAESHPASPASEKELQACDEPLLPWEAA